MPYKDKEEQKNAIKKAVKKHRQGITEGITEQGITSDGTHFIDGIEYIPESFVEGINDGTIREFESLPARPRYLELSDGQVLDRLNQPKANPIRVETMRACNESSYNYHPLEGVLSAELRARLSA